MEIPYELLRLVNDCLRIKLIFSLHCWLFLFTIYVGYSPKLTLVQGDHSKLLDVNLGQKLAEVDP